jgi:hypothetical protein
MRGKIETEGSKKERDNAHLSSLGTQNGGRETYWEGLFLGG